MGDWADDAAPVSSTCFTCVATQPQTRLGDWGYSVVVFAGNFGDPAAAVVGQGCALA